MHVNTRPVLNCARQHTSCFRCIRSVLLFRKHSRSSQLNAFPDTFHFPCPGWLVGSGSVNGVFKRVNPASETEALEGENPAAEAEATEGVKPAAEAETPYGPTAATAAEVPCGVTPANEADALKGPTPDTEAEAPWGLNTATEADEEAFNLGKQPPRPLWTRPPPPPAPRGGPTSNADWRTPTRPWRSASPLRFFSALLAAEIFHQRARWTSRLEQPPSRRHSSARQDKESGVETTALTHKRRVTAILLNSHERLPRKGGEKPWLSHTGRRQRG